MTDHRDLEAKLRDRDGSCRDINFSEHLSAKASLALLEVVSTEWTLSNATDQHGAAISRTDISRLVGIGTGAVTTVWRRGSFLDHLRCFLCWDPTNGVFCELTFFPEDIIGNEPFFKKFTDFLSLLLNAAQQPDYYVRYENASWRHGETGPESGVIFSHHSLPLGGG